MIWKENITVLTVCKIQVNTIDPLCRFLLDNVRCSRRSGVTQVIVISQDKSKLEMIDFILGKIETNLKRQFTFKIIYYIYIKKS